MRLRSVLAASLAASALAGCAADESDLPVVAGACRMKQVAEYDVVPRRGLLTVPAQINGTAVAMVLDTGAERSLVTDETITRLRLLSDPRNESLVTGVGGEGVERADALVDNLRFATYDSGSTHLPVADIPLADDEQPPLSGILGAEAISRFDLDIDLPNGHIGVWRVGHQCGGKFLPWPEPYAAVPAHVNGRGQLLMPITLDGKPMKALVDTGAATLIIDQDAADSLGVNAAVLAKEPVSRGYGAAGVNFHHVAHRFTELDVGPDRLRDVTISVLDRSLQEADMLLGIPYLSRQRVWLSYASEQVFIPQPTSAQAAAP
jgi:predicted aspartyl protease